MRLQQLSAGIILTLLTWAGSTANAQGPGSPPNRPTVSPYLNLLRSNGSPALNYYGLVRPEINNRQNLQAIQSATAANQRTIGDLLNGGELSATGVPTQFLNHGSYFMNQGNGGSAGRGGNGRTSFSTGGGR